ncbi:PRECURSOR OF CEP1-RELATED [Salix purpurea]|uniref:PRECURSOR OF CEP1-RELATED n=1 Tax=Salix purpurea TaxID=77065 RepID=A0A9Q0V191_SALPP|nr:PRECURSOR OF CEP1-RELATED [Salix purpurea]
MAETFKCAFLVLAFVTSFQILFIEGRPIKPTNKQQLLTHEKEPIKELASKSMNTNLHHSTADNQKVSLTSPPVHIPSVHHSADRKESQPMVPRSSDSPSVRHPETPGANSNNGHSVNAFKDDFEPTTPGHSPGVGHIHADKDQDDSEDVDRKAPSSGSSTERAGAAFKPTKPGHSPGVGHMSSVDQSDKTDPKASNFEHSVTTPGHSPGFGHIHADEDQDDSEDVDPKAPSSGSSTGRAGAAFKPTKPGHSPGVGHMSSVDQSDKIDPNPSNIEHSITTPGHSLGFGHILAGQDKDDSEDVDPKAPGSGSSTGRAGAAFKPTTPGHSPGIGHMLSVDQSDKTHPKASNFEHSVTTPGHSLGVSPIHADEDQDDNEDVDPKAPGSDSSTGRAGAAFKPTKPGHSPGVGHKSSVDQCDKTDPNPK